MEHGQHLLDEAEVKLCKLWAAKQPRLEYDKVEFEEEFESLKEVMINHEFLDGISASQVDAIVNQLLCGGLSSEMINMGRITLSEEVLKTASLLLFQCQLIASNFKKWLVL